MRALFPFLFLTVCFPLCRAADFSPAWLQSAYWRDGKAEFNIYEGTVVRYGQPQPAEVTHILVREDFAPEAKVKADDWQRPGVYPVLKLNQILRVQTGIYVYQQMHSGFWRIDDPAAGQLIKWSLTSSDSCGNTSKLAERFERKIDPGTPDELTRTFWEYKYETYWEGMSEGVEEFTPPKDGVFYDELPVRVRGIDFSAGRGAFTVPLAPSVIQSKKDDLRFAPATVSFTTDPAVGQIAVEVAHVGGIDRFFLDAAPPHLLRVWRPAAGGELRLKRSLKIDYWNYHNVGDRERALADPALDNNSAAAQRPR